MDNATNSQLNCHKIDKSGSVISAIRIDTYKAYDEIPKLLQSYIDKDRKSAWKKIKDKIDYLYDNLDILLKNLDEEISFSNIINSEIRKNKKILFKPNIVASASIDPITHGEYVGKAVCSEWPFLAALMRWFHDNLDISYYDMCIGEASTSTHIYSKKFSKIAEREISIESIFEGKNEDFYGGWGFYFVRKYLYDNHPASHYDNPMDGYEDSLSSNYIPPGKSKDKLLVYDLNKIEDSSKGKVVKIPDGANFKEITIHKIVVGGNEEDKEDYPGCVLINLPKLKMHAQDLISNCLKNLSIGLYPSECVKNKYTYKYSYHPSYKGKIPHSPWVMEIDKRTFLPLKDPFGSYMNHQTFGFSGTQCDIIKALLSENVFILHISDAINIINISHEPDGRAVPVPEGFIFASSDPVATDLLCSRYCFNNVTMAEGKALKEKNDWPTEFIQRVPKAHIRKGNIITKEDFDSPLCRYKLYNYAQKRGIGHKKYFVIGYDTLTESPLISINGHLARIENSEVIELITDTMYYNPETFLYDLQKTTFSYLKCLDKITHTNSYKKFINLFDENNDKIIDYDEKGRGAETAILPMLSYLSDMRFKEPYGQLKSSYLLSCYFLKYCNKNYNTDKHDFLKEKELVSLVATAYEMSKSPEISQDLFFPEINYGQGQWPSIQTVKFVSSIKSIYGSFNMNKISLQSMYGCAFQYADKSFNNGYYTGSIDENISNSDSINNYFQDLLNNKPQLPFVFYVPKNYGCLNEIDIPNVVESDDPNKIYTVHFLEVW